MSRPKPKVLLEYANKENYKVEQILESEAIWAVFYTLLPFVHYSLVRQLLEMPDCIDLFGPYLLNLFTGR